MVALWVDVLATVAALVVLLFQGVALYLARQMPRLDAWATTGPADAGRVSVVVAARDEEDDLEAALRALEAQDYADLEIVVVEGGSTDRTREVVERHAPRVRLVPEPPLPPGWVGKNWACWTGARATDGRWLLFVDADVRLHPSAVRSALAWAQEERAALATLAPRVEMLGRWERIVLPFYVQMVLTYFRAPRVNRDDSSTAMANGQFWLTSRADYEALGGHEAVKGQVLEDVAIARRYRRAGRRLRVAWSPLLATTRMYRDRGEMFEGIVKNLHGTEFSATRQVGFLAALVGLFWAPLGLLPYGVLVGSPYLTILGGILAFALFGKHVAFAHAVGAPARYGLAFPVAVGFYVVALASSLRRGLGHGTVSWKGRRYPVGPGQAPKG